MKKIIVISLFVLGMILPNINVKAVSIGEIEVPTVNSGDGLYEDVYEQGRYVYKGSNSNNYIMFNNELWRIVAKEADGTYKILRNEILENRPFNENVNSNDWKTSTLNAYLNGDYYNSLSDEAKKYIVSHDFRIGEVSSSNDLESAVSEEKQAIWNGNVGLISVSDLLNSKIEVNESETWMQDKINLIWRTISPQPFGLIWVVTGGNGFAYLDYDGSIASHGVRPVVFISSDLKFEGDGSKDNPYVVTGIIENETITEEEENNDTNSENNTQNNNQSPQVVEVPSTSAYGSIIIATLGIVCVMVSVFVMKRVTSKN